MASSLKICSEVFVPISVLNSPELITSEKLVWVAVAVHAAIGEKRRLTQLWVAEATGYCRQVVAKGLVRLQALGLCSANKTVVRGSAGGRAIPVPPELLLDTSVSPAARLLRMQLQATAAHKRVLELKWACLCEEAHKGIKSVRKSLDELEEQSWLSVTQANRLAPLCLIRRNPVRECYENWKAVSMRAILTAKFKGEAIMKEIATFLTTSRDYMSDASPAFLNGMEFDLYFPKRNFAMEFNGSQHYMATERYDAETVRKQQLRDAAKREICAREGITLVVVRPQDLSVAWILEKIGNRLPMRDLLGAQPLIDYLDAECAAYRRHCPAVGPC